MLAIYLPLQNPDPDDDYWPTRFGEVHGNTHRTFVHLLGNLSLIGGKENVDLSNKNFNDKMVKISGCGSMNLDKCINRRKQLHHACCCCTASC